MILRAFKLLFVLCLFSSHAIAQRTVTGKVTSAKDGIPLLGVNVIIKGSTKGTATDLGGGFSIEVTDSDTLEFSFVGYMPQDILVGNKTLINVAMTEDTESLDQIVITTALGIKKQPRQLGYAAQSIKAASVTNAAPIDISQGLQGKIAGLNITTANGVGNASSRVIIRGNNSLYGNNQPLIVVDGVITSNDQLAQGNNTGSDSSRDWGNYLSYLDMSTVEDVSVLKGPNAAALYGARGANGVILITSKKGQKRDGLGIEYSSSVALTNVAQFQDLQNEYGGGFAASLWTANPQLPKTADGDSYPAVLYSWQNAYPGHTGIHASQGAIPGGYQTQDIYSWFAASVSWGPKLDGREVLWWDGKKRPYSPQPDNRKYLYRQGIETIHNVSFSSANDYGSIRLGVSRKDGETVLDNNKYNSTNFSLGSHVKISKILSADINAAYNQNFRLNAAEIGNNNSWSKFSIYGMPREYRGLEKEYYQRDDLHQSKFNFPGEYPYAEYSKDLFWHVYNKNNRLWRDELISTIKLNADITPWLTAFVRTSVDLISTRFEETNKTTSVDGLGGGGFSKTISKRRDFNTDIMAILKQEDLFTDGFNASLTLGYNNYSTGDESLKGSNFGAFKVPNVYSLSNWVKIQNTSIKKPEIRRHIKSYAYIGLLDMSYKNYLFLQLTGRQDTNSTLPIDNNSTFYPSANTSFVFSDALDLKNDWFSFGRLRASWGKSANATEPYQLDANFDTDTFGNATTISYPSIVPPANLTFQTSESIEFGLALGFFEDRLNFDFTYYDTASKKQIMDVAIPFSSGSEKLRINTGELTNKGIELTLRANAIRTDNFSWDITLNAARNRNKVVALADDIKEQYLSSVFGTRGAFMRVSEGEEYGSIFGTDFERDSQGRKQVENIYSKEDATEVVGTRYKVTADPVEIGNAAPKFTGGLNNAFRYKNFRLSALIDFKYGGDIYSIDHSVAMGSGLSPATLVERNGGGLPYTFPDGTSANVGVIMDGYNVDDGKVNDRVISPTNYYGVSYGGWSSINKPRSLSVFENTWFKLREVTLTYTLPKEVMKRTKLINNLSVSLVGRNLFYIYSSLPDHLNPEGILGTGNGQGLQWSQFPTMRTFGLSLKAGF